MVWAFGLYTGLDALVPVSRFSYSCTSTVLALPSAASAILADDGRTLYGPMQCKGASCLLLTVGGAAVRPDFSAAGIQLVPVSDTASAGGLRVSACLLDRLPLPVLYEEGVGRLSLVLP